MKDRIEVGKGSTSFVGEGAVHIFRLMTLVRGLRSEIRGMRLTSKGRTCYAMAKEEFGLKGNRQKVLDQLVPLVEAAKARVPVVER